MYLSMEECIEELEDEIKEKQKQIKLLESFDLTQKITEKRWHELCETPLRYSNYLITIVKSIFPDAENITNSSNTVNFELYGFEIEIPNSLCQGININLNWWKKDNGEPELYLNDHMRTMEEYFKALDEHKGWYELVNIRTKRLFKKHKVRLFFYWWFYLKWKAPHRDQYEEYLNDSKEHHKKKIEEYYAERKEIDEKTEVFVNKLLPEIEKFSTQHYNYGGSLWHSTPKVEEVVIAYENKIRM